MTIPAPDTPLHSGDTKTPKQENYGAMDDTNAPEPGSSGSYWGRFQLPEAKAYLVDNDDIETGGGGDDTIPTVVAHIDDRGIRHAFIRKVYGILSAQIFLTFGVCAFITFYEPMRVFAFQTDWMVTLSVVLSFVLLIVLMCFKNQHPVNIILLSVWTISISYAVGIVTAGYYVAGQSWTVVEAIFITGMVFLSLTLYTLQSKRDFSFMEAGLGMGLLVLILW
eukprot:CAMPEP_0172505944 /NCGR_PEP_ID=MMETSP1066-20121228/190375_1 /TAXON_ID=671091 /ORGANISM="Coscinodiscus wailesii, Strain CCMP2513" /LENGTH=221 /DNA_ID=CAMNT_0013282741 /DNA_START=70 /DNA_END=732 /DNA_ORIENTATION=+